MPHSQLRWVQRFENYARAYLLLSEAIALDTERPLSKLEQESLAQRFEYSVELAWKTIKDYLEYEKVYLEQSTPKAVIRSAFLAGIISDGQIWMDTLDARNRLSHTYNSAAFELIITDIKTSYMHVLTELHQFFSAQLTAANKVD